MNQRSFYAAIAATIIFLLTSISGCTSNNLLGGSQKTPEAAIFVSKQAPLMVSMLVNPENLDKLAQVLASPQDRRKTRSELNQLKTSVLANTSLDYDRDVKPWVGDEITAAVTTLDIDRDAKNGQQPGYLMAVATKDAQKSREFLELLFTKRAIAGTELTIEQYNGIKLIGENPRPQLKSSNSTAKTTLSGAVVGDSFVLFANHPQVLKEAITNVQAPELNLGSSSKYQQALTQLPAQKIGLAFLNYPSLSGWKELEPPPQTYESQIVALELNRQGIFAETTLVAAPEKEILPSPPALPQSPKTLQYLPASVRLAIVGSDLSKLENSNLQQLWQQVSPALSVSNLIKQPVTEIQQRWGLDLQSDVFSWVQGEYALGMLPNNDWIFVVEKSPTAEQGISQLDAIASTKGLSITPLPLQEQKTSAWTQLTTIPADPKNPDKAAINLTAKVQGLHTTVDNYEIFATSIDAMEQAFKASKNGALVNDGKFKASVNAIPQPNEGYVYVDWLANQPMLERQLPVIRLLEIAGKPFFSNLRSLTISSYGNEDNLLKGGIFFKLNS
ncbi:DUF3352 domain-containing protein [Aliterella atlantica]|uniref:DUF3352 domain-containing protein n=1 Tax=Aliterella atlantica CENA595 TaxID=1618023 RepID=A0A0D8ZZV8_9CYAN|nr:DUF3352 domain-containing protein [Aliterella atlantica]KJH72741.1 hypothetical protein UH38_04040 [Aliterella atlantica CENA595]